MGTRRIVLFAVLCFIVSALFFPLISCAPAPRVIMPEFQTSGDLIWPPPPAATRIKWVANWSNRYDFGKPSKTMEFLIGRERVEQLRRPSDVVADAAGNIYVADAESRIVFIFDQEKKALRFIGLRRLGVPVGLAVSNKRGMIFVSDSQQNKVFGFDMRTDNLKLSIGGPGEFKKPSGMVYDDASDRLYIADTQNHAVKVFDRDGRHIFTIGNRGNADGEFNFPSFLAMDRNGILYVVDSFNFRVQMFDANGKFMKKFGRLGDASGSFSRPAGISVDSDGNIYVVDTSFNNFQIFDNNGKLLMWVGNAGRNPGEFYLPTGIFVDSQDRIYVADTFNRRVQVFQYLKAN